MQERAATGDDEAATAADINERGERKQKRFGEEVVPTTGSRASGGRKERGSDGRTQTTVNWRMVVLAPPRWAIPSPRYSLFRTKTNEEQ